MKFGYLNKIRKSTIVIFAESPMLVWQTQWQMFLLVSGQHGVSVTSLNVVKKICRYISHKKHCSDLNLGGSLSIFTFFFFFFSIKWEVPPMQVVQICQNRRSFFEASRIYLQQHLPFLWKWAQRDSLRVMSLEGIASRKTLIKLAWRCREVAWCALILHPVPMLGGPGVIIQIDESKFNDKSKVSRLCLPLDTM